MVHLARSVKAVKAHLFFLLAFLFRIRAHLRLDLESAKSLPFLAPLICLLV
jgi:hypothetical protein